MFYVATEDGVKTPSLECEFFEVTFVVPALAGIGPAEFRLKPVLRTFSDA